MTKLRNTTLNYCGLCRYVKAIKLKKIVGQSLFKNHLKFQNFNKVCHCDMAKRGHNNRKFLENIFTQKLL